LREGEEPPTTIPPTPPLPPEDDEEDEDEEEEEEDESESSGVRCVGERGNIGTDVVVLSDSPELVCPSRSKRTFMFTIVFCGSPCV